MKIVVTGGAGFIGSHVTKLLLDAGHSVVVLDNLSHGSKDSLDGRATLIIGDIQDQSKTREALEGAEAVVHMAGLIIVPESVREPVKYCENNVIGTVNLLSAMKDTKVTRIIFSSSACVYGMPDKLPIKEDAPIRPDNPYGAGKAAVEVFLQAFHANFKFDVTILRYFNPYGPGEMHQPETHAIPNFIKAALNKKPIPLYWRGEQIRDFIYIEDLARAHIDVLKLRGFNIFNIGTENGVKVKEVVDLIFKILSYEVVIDDLGERPGDVAAYFASSEKIKKAVGWQVRVSLEEGLRATADFYKNQRPLKT